LINLSAACADVDPEVRLRAGYDAGLASLCGTPEALSMITVTSDDFVRAETNRMLVGLQAQAGGGNRSRHLREPASLEEQTVSG
jgi:hypothetical protein